MVKGLEKFKEHFAGFEDNYVIIGGTACDIALRDTDMRPRATDDIDMILVIEKMTPEFGQRFWDFIVEGQYKNRQRKRDDKEPITELFRFSDPKNGFPVQIELLSKFPDVLGEPTGFHFTEKRTQSARNMMKKRLLSVDFHVTNMKPSMPPNWYLNASVNGLRKPI